MKESPSHGEPVEQTEQPRLKLRCSGLPAAVKCPASVIVEPGALAIGSDKHYQVIYADPPWRYDFSKSDSRQVENQYPTMTTVEIAALNVPAACDSALFLWATAPKLEDALAVLKAWGFTYKSHLAWDKETMGMGYWFRGQHELLLVGVKNHFPPPPQSLRVSSVFRQRRGKHSKKPDGIRDLIASWYPDAARIELFARQRVPGWDSWGNEIQDNA